MRKRIGRGTLVLLLLAAMVLCGGTGYAAAPDPRPPAGNTASSGEASSGEPGSGEPSAEPMTPGVYEGSDDSVLTVERDGTCAYETLVSGTINGVPMSGRLVFHGTGEEGAFTFTRVTWNGLDLTEIARSLGFDDASPWEQAAAAIYASARERFGGETPLS